MIDHHTFAAGTGRISARHSDKRAPAWLLRWGLVFLLALLVRLLAIRLFSQPPVADLLWNDAVGWNLAQGHGFTASQGPPYLPGIYRTPGYPAFLALVYWLFGHSYGAVFTVQAVLDAASAVLIGAIALRLLSPRIARITGVLYALYPYPAMFCGVLHQDILLTFSVLVTLLLVTGTRGQVNRPVRWLSVGLAVGVVSLVKGFLILYGLVPALVILLASGNWRRKTASLALLSFGIALVIAPWMVRNYRLFHRVLPLATSGVGSDMLLLVQEIDEGEEGLLRAARAAAAKHTPAAQQLRDLGDGADLIASEQEKARRAAPALARRWPRYMLLIVRHIPRLWITQYTLSHQRAVALAGQVISWGAIIPGVLGMVLLRRQWRRLLALYATLLFITLIYAPYLVEARYTLPARPVLILFVASALSLATERRQRAHSVARVA